MKWYSGRDSRDKLSCAVHVPCLFAMEITENKDTMQWFIQPDVIIQRAQCDETTQIFIIIYKAQCFEIWVHVMDKHRRHVPALA